MANENTTTTEKQTLILWALLSRDGSAAYQNELKPEPSKLDREALKKAGLIDSAPKGRNSRIWIEVTEKGWAWATEHLDQPLPQRSTAGSAILQAWLTRLKAHMGVTNTPLSEILNPQGPRSSKSNIARERAAKVPESQVPIDAYNELRERVRQAYLAVTGHRLNSRARLSELREKLPEIERDVLDGALIRMQREEYASLYPLDNKAEITDADRGAAIYFGDEPRHILWLPK